eukprot:5700427-Alexandrium_andersonii.AAC.1
MSASLVGSEMCIRDSALICIERGVIVRGRPNLGPWHVARWLGQQPPPVSYTHLTLPTICSV